MSEPSEAAIAAWTRLVRISQDVLGRIEADLKRAGLPPLAWYDALLELRRAPDGLRPFELQRAMLLAQYNMSRLVDRLEAADLVAREPSPEDRRGQVLRLTDAGRALLERMWPSYRAAIARHFADRLREDEAVVLRDLLEKLRP